VRHTLEGHSHWVESVAFSPDGKLVVSGSGDRTAAWLWGVETGAARQTLEGHSGWIKSVAFSPDGKLVVLASGDNTGGSGDTTATLDTSLEQLYSLSISHDWVTEGGESILWLPPDYRATCVAVWTRIVVLGHSLRRVSFLRFEEGSKLV
jgi:WD40 repeat protein